MSGPARTLLGFGCYLLVLGAVLVLAPDTLLQLFGMAPTVEVWIRVAGMLVLVLGAYDLLAALADLREFIRWSIPMRMVETAFLALFVLLGYAPSALLLFAFAEVAGAAWTWLALRRVSAAANASV